MHSVDVFSTNSANFRVAFVVVVASFLSFISSLFLFLCGDFELFFFLVWVEIVGVHVD